MKFLEGLEQITAKKLFVVTIAVRYEEGGSVLGVFSTYDLACAAIGALSPSERGDEQSINEITLDAALALNGRIYL